MSYPSTVELKVSREGMIQSMADSFTERESFLVELLQNARRSGASEIFIATNPNNASIAISDNGSGIDDPQSLFSFGRSDWNTSEDIERESPFGVGFASAIFSAQSIYIASNGWAIRESTQNLRDMKQSKVRPSTCDKGTKIDLGLAPNDYAMLQLEKTIPSLVRGFRVPVNFNGEWLAREHAIDQVDGSMGETTVGDIHMNSFPDLVGRGTLEAYLQGILIAVVRFTPGGRVHAFNCEPSGHSIDHSVGFVHLDSTRFRARMPDRSQLINPSESLDEISRAVENYLVEKLYLAEKNMDTESFVHYHHKDAMNWARELLNDKPMPAANLKRFIDLPYYNEFDAFGESFSTPYFSGGGVLIRPDTSMTIIHAVYPNLWCYDGVQLDECPEGSQTTAMLAYLAHTGLPIVNRESNYVHHDHWINDKAIDMEALATSGLINIGEVSNPKNPMRLAGREFTILVQFCDSYTVTVDHPDLHDVEITEYPCIDKDRDAIIFPRQAGVAQVEGILRQVSDYVDSMGEFDVEALAADREELMRLASFAHDNNTSEFFREMIEPLTFNHPDILSNKSFTVTFDSKGAMQVCENSQ